MALAPGTRFGSHEITAPLGAGGMGEVYRARDTNLKREVAIKVLPTALASDAERLARFQREAELLAALNHPNIAQIYGLERSDGATALVMELVSGQTLAERFAHGALSVEEALGLARQIADALEAAHERGIVHRDLKPANVLLTADGIVKVLDFGIAKALDTRTTGPGPAVLTTPAMTEAGIVLGTASYMSPEQARGKAVDQRADIWTFGCLLYELLTGQLAFGGEDVTLVLARVLERSPDFAALPASTPPAVRRTLELCLEKDPKKRIADIRDVKLALAGAFGSTVVNAERPPFWRARAALVAMTGVAALLLGAVAWLMSRPVAAPLPETHLEISAPATTTPTAFAISTDGRRVVYSAAEEGRAFLWVRSLDGGVSTRLEGTEDALTPFWSPDGRSLAFFKDRALRAIDVTSGAIRTLSFAAQGNGGSWNSQGDVLFAPTGVGGIFRVSAQGGERVTVTELTPGQRSHEFPVFLPNGRDFLFFADGSEAGVYAGSLGESEPKRVIDADGPAAYASGHLIYPRQGRLFAQPFDLDSLSAIGEAIRVEGFAGDDGRNAIAVAASATGVVVYRTEAADTGGRRLVWFDRSGAEILSVEGGERSGAFALSPDEGRLATARTAGGNSDIWMFDLRRGVSSRFTTASMSATGSSRRMPRGYSTSPMSRGSSKSTCNLSVARASAYRYRSAAARRRGGAPMAARSSTWRSTGG